MEPLFLTKFRDFKTQWANNQLRIEGFSAYTRAAGEEKKTHKEGTEWKYGDSIDVSALPSLQRINALGFFTTDSQLGVSKGKEQQRAYCEGFIPLKLLGPFITNIHKCNGNINYVEYPNEDNSQPIPLTKDDKMEYTHVADYTGEDLTNYVIPKILNAGVRGNTESYYTGKGFSSINIELTEWRFIIVYDTEFGHNALDESGLFTCIEKALKQALIDYKPPPTGGMRRRTKKHKRRQRKTRRRHK